MENINTHPQSTCAVSIVIPMYNAEKYIGECLESILVQTFQDFEVIVVDDCSTDNSRKIAESYLEKFGERLKIYDNEKNSGAGTTRNNGLKYAIGEYIFFADADDMMKTKTAFEEMYTSAKDYDADIVYCERYFKADDNGENIGRFITAGARRVSKPTLEPEDLEERVKYILEKNFWGVPWCKFVKRKFLFENEIFFPNMRVCEDHIWTFGLFFFAKRFLRIPNAVYVRRMSKMSATRGKKSSAERMNLWIGAAILGLKYLDNMMGRTELFNQKSQYRYELMEQFAVNMFDISLKYTVKLSQYVVYESIKNEFGAKLGDQDILVSVLASIINKYQRTIMSYNERIAKLEEQLKSK